MTYEPFHLSRLAEICGGEMAGDDVVLEGASGLEDAGPGDIAFLRPGLPAAALDDCQAGAIVVAPDFAALDRPLLRHPNPRRAWAMSLELLRPPEPRVPGIHAAAFVDAAATVHETCSVGPGAVVGPGAIVGARTTVAPHAIIGPRAVIGEECRLDPHVVVYADSVIGDRVILFAGAVIGCDGFGIERDGGRTVRMHHIGVTILEDDVEIGAHSCVDRGTTGRTIVRSGAKIDNQVMIAHNAIIGRDAIIAAQTGIAGSSELGDRVTMGGDCAVADHARIGSDVTIGGRSGVFFEVPDGSVWSGFPAHDHRQVRREMIALERLPEALKELRRLRREVDALRAARDDEDAS